MVEIGNQTEIECTYLDVLSGQGQAAAKFVLDARVELQHARSFWIRGPCGGAQQSVADLIGGLEERGSARARGSD